jgi:transcriptional regulator with XRE-family HTH domain
MEHNVFAQRLVEYRKAARLKQKEVYELTGISTSSLCRWEHGVSKPSAEQLEILLALYNERLGLLYPEYVPVTILPPLKTDGAVNREAIGRFREELEAFNGHARNLMDIISELDNMKY